MESDLANAPQPLVTPPMPVSEPTEKILHGLRKEGFRPEAVACFINNRKVLLLFKKEHNLWQLPQGGIHEGETGAQALQREMTEEMGSEFSASCNWAEATVVHYDKVEFLPREDLKNQLAVDGKDVPLLGKAYFFYKIPCASESFDITKTDFTDYFWLDFTAGVFLAKKMYQSGKRRITLGVLDVLKNMGVID
jgi:8-oxo-dGTP pyrophosphatase MutT (NUDIX family)